MALTHLRAQRLTCCPTQRSGSRGLLHDASGATQTINGRSDEREVLGAGELGKPHGITTRFSSGAMGPHPHGADASLCPGVWGEQGKGLQAQTTRLQGPLAASAWLA